MHQARFAACLALVLPFAACAGSQALYPQPYIGKGTPIPVSAADVAAFRSRSLHAPPRADLQDLAESYISRDVPHPSSVAFEGEFESVGKSTAICGRIKYRNKEGQMTGWRPFFVEFTTKPYKGQAAPYSYNPEDELVKLCGPSAATPSG